VDALLSDHGLSAVLVVRLVPLVPFIAINYASGLSGVRFRHYVLGSALGMVPGSLAYAALGAYGSNPWGLAAAGSAPWWFSSSAGPGGRDGWTRVAWTTPPRTTPMLDATARHVLDRPLSQLEGHLATCEKCTQVASCRCHLSV